MFDKIVSSIGKFSYKYRKIIAVLGALLFIAVTILQALTVVEFTYAEESVVSDIFPQDDTLVIVYNKYDEDRIPTLIEHLEKDEHVTSVQAYANTLGIKLSPAEISEMLGIDIVFVNTLYYIYENGMLTEGMTFVDFVTFISSDEFLSNEMFASMIDDDSKAQIYQLRDLVNAINSVKRYTAPQIAEMFDIDVNTVNIIFYIKQLMNITASNSINTIFATAAKALGMAPDIIETLFKVKPVEKMTFNDFVLTLKTIYPYVKDFLNSEQAAQFDSLISIHASIKENAEIFPEDIAEMFSSMEGAEMFNKDTITLLYIMSRSNTMDYSDKKVALYDFFIFLAEDIVGNESLSAFFDEDVASQLDSAKAEMVNGRSQLVGKEHSRMIVTLNYVPESPEIQAFYDDLTDTLDSLMLHDYYLVGNTAMSYEVSQTFHNEFLLITLVTAAVILLVVLITFKNIPVSLLLICVIECAVFAMMSVMTVANSPIFFIALILVQCILMGTMIDYAILFTTYYREARKTFSIEDALPETMRKSTYAILTSSLILVLVTFICGLNMTGTVAAILQTLSVGAFCAILLILFVLPSYLVIFDKWITKENT